jgi:MerR family mercuric resistance operon transcriptional regulator
MKSASDGVALTIGALAQAAGVGVETVRYYQRRGLLPVPPRLAGSVRRYGAGAAARIGFIKRAQELGFSLDEIAELLRLQDGTDRRSIRRIAQARLQQIRGRLTDLRRMERALAHLIDACEHDPRAPRCPIVASIADVARTAAGKAR